MVTTMYNKTNNLLACILACRVSDTAEYKLFQSLMAASCVLASFCDMF